MLCQVNQRTCGHARLDVRMICLLWTLLSCNLKERVTEMLCQVNQRTCGHARLDVRMICLGQSKQSSPTSLF